MTQPDTKTRILDVAEGLFAEKGYASTSLRDITRAAGTNLASVNYHFQSKEGLLSAVLERIVGPVNRERLAALDALEAEAGGAPLDLPSLLRAFLAPAFVRWSRLGAESTRIMHLAGRMHSETDEHLRTLFLVPFEEVIRRFGRAFRKAMPGLDEREIQLRTHFLVGAMAHTLLWSGSAPLTPFGRRRAVLPDEALESLVRFAAAGLGAPAPRGRKTGRHKEAQG